MLQLLGPSKQEREKCKLELNRILTDLEKLSKVFDVPHETVEQKREWFRQRLHVLNDQEIHPLARLSSSELFHDMVLDYVKKLKEASKGNNRAFKEVELTRKKIKSVLEDEESRLKEQLEKLAEVLSQTGKWQDQRDHASEDRKVSLQKLEMVRPKDVDDWHQWKTYYTTRAKILENEAIDPAARMLWTNHSEKEEMVKEYFDYLSQLISGKQIEHELHELEAHMEAIVVAEARRIRDQYAEFFEVEM